MQETLSGNDLEESMKEELKSTKKMVLKMLEQYPPARNDDLYLIYLVWTKCQHLPVYLPFAKFKELASTETIRRTRQLIQNRDCKYLPSDPEVARKRKIKEEVYRQAMGRGYDV